MDIDYKVNDDVTSVELAQVFNESGIVRPTDDDERLNKMLSNANLIITARAGGKLVGIARSLTDFSYCCYLSDLAVSKKYQKNGIGRELVRLTRDAISDYSILILLSAPGAMDYYPKLNFEKAGNCFIIKRKR